MPDPPCGRCVSRTANDSAYLLRVSAHRTGPGPESRLIQWTLRARSLSWPYVGHRSPASRYAVLTRPVRAAAPPPGGAFFLLAPTRRTDGPPNAALPV